MLNKPSAFAHIPDEWITNVQTSDVQTIGCMVWVSSDAGGSTWKPAGPFACCCVVNEGLDSITTNVPIGQTLYLKNGQGLSSC
jgi:hypothetical protein